MAIKRKKRRRKKRYHTGLYVSAKTGLTSKYRSGWELLYMQWLDSQESVKTFEYECVKIPYVSNVRTGKIRTYNPDFLVEYIDGIKHLVEIKPSRRVSQANVQKKIIAAREWCNAHSVTMVIVTEVELKILGLL